MKAVVMAGGEGSRLRPLTLERPKPMLPLAHAPAIEHILRLLRRHGITDIVITLHYRGSDIANYFQSGEDLGLNITYTQEDRPLGTAGSVALARDVLDEPFVVISGDALTDVDLTSFCASHGRRQAMASLLLYRVANPLEYGVVVTGADGRIDRFQEKPSWGEVQSDTVNTGIYTLQPSVFEFIPPGEAVDFSLDVFPQLLRRGLPLYGYVADGYWTDIGTLDAYRDAVTDLVSGRVPASDAPAFREGAPTVDPSSRVHADARLLGSVYVGRECEIRAHAVLSGPASVGDHTIVDERAEIRESVVLSNVFIGADSQLERCIVGRQCHVGRGVTLGQGAVIGDGTTVGAHASVRAGVRIWPRKFVDEGALVDRSLIHGAEARRSIFTHGGVAGVANFEMTPEFAARLGAAWGSSLEVGRSVVANRDASRPARMAKRAFMAGLASVGVGVLDIGATPFPVARQATAAYQAAGCVHVRLSPYDPTSIDVRFLSDRGTDLNPAAERKVETIFTREEFRRVGAAAIAEITTRSAVDGYVDGLLDGLGWDVQTGVPLGVVADYMGGTCGEVLPAILARLGVRETAIDAAPASGDPDYRDLDDRLARLGRIVTAVEAAVGVLLGADGNRIWIVDETGRQLSELEALGLVLRVLHHAGARGGIALPFTVPMRVVKLATQLGFEPYLTKANVPAMMEAAATRDTVLMASGRRAFGFPRFHPGPDAMATVVHLVGGLRARELSVSQIVDDLPPFPVVTLEVPVSWDKRGAVMRALNDHELRVDEGELDGVVFNAAGGRAAVLPDIDRPVFQVSAEGATAREAQELADRIGALVVEVGT